MARRTYQLAREIAQRLNLAREARGLTVRQLARAAMVSQQTVITLSQGGTINPGAATLVDLARALEVRPAWLILGDGEMDRA